MIPAPTCRLTSTRQTPGAPHARDWQAWVVYYRVKSAYEVLKIENPLTGERVTFLATTEETSGEYVRIRNETSAGARGVVLHYHLTYTETFKVLDGRLDMCVGNDKNHLVLPPGGSAFVPVRTPHRLLELKQRVPRLRGRDQTRAQLRETSQGPVRPGG
jgi:mannose-6-phosphate isomerase-like protein (cupin superfamily)